MRHTPCHCGFARQSRPHPVKLVFQGRAPPSKDDYRFGLGLRVPPEPRQTETTQKACDKVSRCKGRTRCYLSPRCRIIHPYPKPQTLNPKPYTLNPKPQTLNPKPQTLNPKPYTLNPKPYTLNPKPYTLNPKPYTLNPKPTPYAFGFSSPGFRVWGLPKFGGHPLNPGSPDPRRGR